jgi:dTDP-4-amino-4,6-dideoxygalactose transaminase
MQIKVPFLDLWLQHLPLMGELNLAIQDVIQSSAFAGGQFVTAFEEDFAAYCEAPYALGVGSGTEALWLSLVACGIGPGDEVITVPSTFMATAEAITQCGARPVFVDIDRNTYTMDPEALKKALTRNTKAIIPVHLFGQPADMDPIVKFAKQQGLHLIEDACQAHGAEYKGRRVGSFDRLELSHGRNSSSCSPSQVAAAGDCQSTPAGARGPL